MRDHFAKTGGSGAYVARIKPRRKAGIPCPNSLSHSLSHCLSHCPPRHPQRVLWPPMAQENDNKRPWRNRYCSSRILNTHTHTPCNGRFGKLLTKNLNRKTPRCASVGCEPQHVMDLGLTERTHRRDAKGHTNGHKRTGKDTKGHNVICHRA